MRERMSHVWIGRRFLPERYVQACRLLAARRGKFLLEFPDFIEGLDTLAAMRDTQRLLVDLVERPGWVHESLAKITECWRRVYDTYYEFMADEVGGSSFWAWAPGRIQWQ